MLAGNRRRPPGHQLSPLPVDVAIAHINVKVDCGRCLILGSPVHFLDQCNLVDTISLRLVAT